MAVTTVNSGHNEISFTYPSGDVFLRERNYFVISPLLQVDIFSIKIGSKTLNFGGFAPGEDFIIDASAYYKNHKNFDVVIDFMSVYGYDTMTISISSNTYDCYNPFKEITGSICNETGMAFITPPFRMLRGNADVKSLFCAKRAAGNDIFAYRWNINGADDGSVIIRKNINIGATPFVAKYIRKLIVPKKDIIESTIIRSTEARDVTRDVVYVTWRTRWGLDVSHVFYLKEYATDKDDDKEVESNYYYKELSKHVIKGSFYLDNIRDPYDIWYYQTLANSELVLLTFDRWSTLPDIYMTNGTNDFNGVKIKKCNIKDAVVDGVTQSTITFDFEIR